MCTHINMCSHMHIGLLPLNLYNISCLSLPNPYPNPSIPIPTPTLLICTVGPLQDLT